MTGSKKMFNVSFGSVAEKARDDATKFGILLLKVAQADSVLRDHDTVAAILAAANTEADFTNYARKTSITATLAVDDTNELADVDIPDQTWSSAGNSGTAEGVGAGNNVLVKLIVFYEDAAADATRIPLTMHSFDASTNGTDLKAIVATAGFWRGEDGS